MFNKNNLPIETIVRLNKLFVFFFSFYLRLFFCFEREKKQEIFFYFFYFFVIFDIVDCCQKNCWLESLTGFWFFFSISFKYFSFIIFSKKWSVIRFKYYLLIISIKGIFILWKFYKLLDFKIFVFFSSKIYLCLFYFHLFLLIFYLKRIKRKRKLVKINRITLQLLINNICSNLSLQILKNLFSLPIQQ